MSARRSQGPGFTIVELLLVMVMLGALAALALPNLNRAVGAPCAHREGHRRHHGQDRLTLSMGADGRQSYAIEAIQVEVAEVHRLYTVHYTDEGGGQTMQLFVYNDGLLRLRNPSEVRWTRQAS